MADTVYAVDGYLDAGYTVYTADAGAGLSATVRVPQDNYIQDNYAEAGYFGLGQLLAGAIKSGQSSLTGTASVSVSAGRIRNPQTTAVLALASLATQTVSAGATRRITQNLSSSGSVACSAGTRKTATASLTAFDTVTVTALPRKNFSGDLACVSSLSASANVTRDAGYPTATVTWDSQDSSWDDWQHLYWDPDNGIWISTRSSLYAFPIVTGSQQHLLTSAFSIYPIGGQVQTGIANLVENQSDIFVIGGYEKTTGGTVSVSSTLTVPGEKLHSTTGSDISTSFSISAQADVIPPTRGTADLQSQFTIYPNGGQFQTGTIDLASEFTIYALGKTPGIQEASAGITARASSIVAGARRAGADSAVSAQAQASATSIRIRRTADDLSSQFSQLAIPTRKRPGLATIASVATYSATCTRIQRSPAALSSTCSFAVNGGQLASAGGLLNTAFGMPVLGGRLASGQALLQALGFTLQAGDVYWFDPDLVLRVIPESRFYAVLGETRSLTVADETRVNMVLDELRTLDVPEETRSLQVIA